jgi:hypothetical protein
MRFNKKKFPHLVKGEIIDDVDFMARHKNEFKPLMLNHIFSKVHRVCNPSYISSAFNNAATSNYEKIKHECSYLHNTPFSFIDKRGLHNFGVAGSIHIWVYQKRIVRVNIFNVNDEKSTACPIGFNTYIPGDVSERHLMFDYHYTFAILGFKEKSAIKTKTLPPKKKIKEFHCRYKSDIDYPIELLTENWYTKSIQSHPFVVRGHWRLQPCGKDREDRKLIFIDSFMKQGYDKGAYKLKEA